MGLRLMVERLVEDEIGLFETLCYVTDFPLHFRLAHRHGIAGVLEVLGGPFDLDHFLPVHNGVAANTRIGAARAKTIERIDHEGKRLVIDFDLLDGCRRYGLVHRRDGEDRLALIHRLHGQSAIAADQVVGLGKIVGRDDAHDAFHGERFAVVDVPHARVGHLAKEELRKKHTLGPEVFRVPSLTRHFRDEVRRDVIGSKQFSFSHVKPPACNRRRSRRSRGFCCSRSSGTDCPKGLALPPLVSDSGSRPPWRPCS